MQEFAVQSIQLAAPTAQVFNFIADPCNLPRWAQAFKKVSDGRANLQTLNGATEVDLKWRLRRNRERLTGQ